MVAPGCRASNTASILAKAAAKNSSLFEQAALALASLAWLPVGAVAGFCNILWNELSRATSNGKAAFSYPRPFLNADPTAPKVEGDTDACAPSKVNSSSVAAIRKGKKWADAKGNLKITRERSSQP